jgi:UDP-2,3-diacylglucosamine pyrophosphatase LpxH
MIVAISDVHLGYENCNKDLFLRFIQEFLEQEDIEHLVLLGDIVDFWRRLSMGVVLENLEILQRLNSMKANKYYVIGNHDYSFSCFVNNKEELGFRFVHDLLLESGDKRYKFIHGYQLEFERILPLYLEICEYLCETGDEWGKRYSDLYDWYEKNDKIKFVRKLINNLLGKEEGLFDERLKDIGDLKSLNKEGLQSLVEFIEKSPKNRQMSQLYKKELWDAKLELALIQKAIEIKPNEVLIFGHTHEPFCEKDRANAGSWVTEAEKKYSYLIIDNGNMELMFFG